MNITWYNDVAVPVTDMAGNTASNLLLIDSAIDTETQIEGSGDIELTGDQDEVMISSNAPTTITIPEDMT
jgi:hypothetical protein